MSLPTVRIVSFDAVGTLIYAYPSVGAIYAEVLARHGVTVQPAWIESRFREGFRSAIAKPRERISEVEERRFWERVVAHVFDHLLAPEQFAAAFDELWETFSHGHRWRSRADAAPVLRILRERGYRLVVVSNSDARFHQVFGDLALTPLFERIFVSSELGAEKPSPALFRAIEGELDCTPDEVLHIGDSMHHDLNGAELAGWHARLLIADDGKPPPDGIAAIRALAELLDLLPAVSGK